MRAGGVLVQCTYNGGNTRGMKWTHAACTRRRFGLSGDDKAARVIADSNRYQNSDLLEFADENLQTAELEFILGIF